MVWCFLLWYVQTTGSRGLPPTLETHTFRIGAKYRGNTFSSHTLGVTAGTSGHYVLTTDPKEAHFGVYINARMDRYPNTARSTRQRRNSVKIDKAPETPRALRRVPRKSTKAEVDETDLVQVLADPVPQGLNSVGLRQEGKAASPTSWYVYQDKPYFLQPTAWRAKTSDTRKLHIRWINEIKSMPAEYLDRDLPQAIMEYVRHIAVMRQWKWSTYAKNLSAIESALESLPLYTNQKKGIFLKECPEWRDNLLGAQLKERESVAQPPEPLTIDMYDKARKALEHREPVAELYLTMLWMFAARPRTSADSESAT
eukprot:gene11257-biopygen8184